VRTATAERLSDADADPGTPVLGAVDGRRLDLAVRLARLVLRPIEFADDAYCRLGPFGPPQVRAMAVHHAFGPPVNRALSHAIGFDAVTFSPDMMMRLTSSARSRLAVLLVTEPTDVVQRVASMLAAAVLSRRVLRLVLKNERARVRETMGEDGFHIAIHEAPLLHSVLAELDRDTADTAMLADGSDAVERRERVVAFGFAVIGRFLDATEAVLADLLAARLPPGIRYDERDTMVQRLTEVHCEHVVKLVRRRQRSWLASIG